MRIVTIKLKTIVLLISLLIFVGCSKNQEIPENSKIVAKYIVWNEKISPKRTDCTSELKSFNEMHKFDCSFKLNNNEFDIKEKFTLNNKGDLKEYWVYRSESPLVYTLSDLKEDPKYFNSINAKNLKIVLLKSKTEISSSGNIFIIEKILKNEKLIFAKQDANLEANKFRTVFQYESK